MFHGQSLLQRLENRLFKNERDDVKQRKVFYFILGFASFSAAMVIYSVVKGDLATAAFNLVCFAINVWCLRVVYSSGKDHLEDVCGQILNLRINVLSDRMDTEHKYSSQLSKLTGERLSNLEHKYNELEDRVKSQECLQIPLGGIALSGYTEFPPLNPYELSDNPSKEEVVEYIQKFEAYMDWKLGRRKEAQSAEVTCPKCGKESMPPKDLRPYFVGCSDCYNSEYGKFLERIGNKDGI